MGKILLKVKKLQVLLISWAANNFHKGAVL